MQMYIVLPFGLTLGQVCVCIGWRGVSFPVINHRTRSFRLHNYILSFSLVLDCTIESSLCWSFLMTHGSALFFFFPYLSEKTTHNWIKQCLFWYALIVEQSYLNSWLAHWILQNFIHVIHDAAACKDTLD